ncbi:MAG: hypothetical protein HFJ84_05135 [Clostridiales bacterium]|nr:hypothetical protein [Clostridiales bacterium]
MKEKDYHIYLTEQERSQVIQSLIDLKNDLMAQGRYTDAVDDVLIKISKAQKKRIVVKYI